VPWVLPVDGLADLAHQIGSLSAAVGQPPPARPFRGHLTLARVRPPAQPDDLPDATVDAAWAVDELTLVCSHLHPDGARYEVVGRWPVGSH
jgi:2'-5' RNA ligase